jgi:hypothetical protein
MLIRIGEQDSSLHPETTHYQLRVDGLGSLKSDVNRWLRGAVNLPPARLKGIRL